MLPRRKLPGAIRDEDRYGMAKTVAMSARDHGADIGDPDAVTGFLEDVQADRVVLDEDLLERAARRRGDEAMERKFAQLPVRRPPAPELAAAAERSTVVGQLRAFTVVGGCAAVAGAAPLRRDRARPDGRDLQHAGAGSGGGFGGLGVGDDQGALRRGFAQPACAVEPARGGG